MNEPKREKSRAAIPVFEQLKLFLEGHRVRSGNLNQRYILQSPQEKPLNLDALAKDGIRLAFKTAKLPSHGGMLFDAVWPRTSTGWSLIQQILRHANVNTTMNIYVKMVLQDAAAAMKTLEASCATTVHKNASPRSRTENPYRELTGNIREFIFLIRKNALSLTI